MSNPSKKFIGAETLKSYNPSAAFRRKERVVEKKKNKAERRHTREQSLLKRNPVVIKEELDKLLALQKSGQNLSDGQRRRIQKLEQLWGLVVQSVEAERRARSADVSCVASGADGRQIRAKLNEGGDAEAEEQRRLYNPELCNTGIFRHPDGSLRPYPPQVATDPSEQRRRFVESQRKRGWTSSSSRVAPVSEASSGNESEGDEDKVQETRDGDAPLASEEAAEDFLASIPLPAEPPPEEESAGPSQSPSQPPSGVPGQGLPGMPAVPCPVPPLAGGLPQALPMVPLPGGGMVPPPVFFPPLFLPPFLQVPPPPPPPSSMMTPGGASLPCSAQTRGTSALGQGAAEASLTSASSAQGQEAKASSSTAAGVSPPPPEHRLSRNAGGGIPRSSSEASKKVSSAALKGAMTFVPTQLRTKAKQATPKTVESLRPSVSQVSVFAVAPSLGGRHATAKNPSNSGGGSGVSRFFGEAKAARSAETANPQDLDKAFDEFLKEVGAA